LCTSQGPPCPPADLIQAGMLPEARRAFTLAVQAW
jgi:hypothetical protein